MIPPSYLCREEEGEKFEKTAEEVVREAMTNLLDYTKIESKYEPPPPRTLKDDVKDAIAIREYMEARNKTAICSCCSRRRERDSVQWSHLSTIPNLDLLLSKDADDGLAPTPEFPRDSLTVFRKWCLQVRARRSSYDRSIAIYFFMDLEHI